MVHFDSVPIKEQKNKFREKEKMQRRFAFDTCRSSSFVFCIMGDYYEELTASLPRNPSQIDVG